MKNKFLKILGLAVTASVLALSIAACGPSDEGDPNDPNTPDPLPSGATQFVFEAEYVDCSGITNAPGFSGGGGGTDIVGADMNSTLGASNRFYVTYLYGENVTIEFHITSDKAVADATIVARLSAEGGKNFTISPSNYTIEVNGTPLNYSPIQFRNVPPLPGALAFQDYTLARNVSLVEGENVVKFITSNNTSLGGTTEATAPMIDCLKITTSATLTWEPVESNLDQF